jgi:hemerythrin superfamily protein
MDIFSLLKQDHQNVSRLLAALHEASIKADLSERRRLFGQIKDELSVHAQVEEKHVYPVFQQADQTSEAAAEALEEHRRMKTLVMALESGPEDSSWVSKMLDLRKAVEHHVQEEEHDLFVKARSVLTAAEAEELGRVVEAAKKEIKGEAPAPAGGATRN